MSEIIEKSYYAHTKEGRPPEEWQPLGDHLTRVAELTRSFADEFGAGEWGYLAGLWHDLGKYSKEFQKYLSSSGDPDAHIEAKPGRVDHSTAGAQHSFRKSKSEGKLLAYAIAGHHAGPQRAPFPPRQKPLLLSTLLLYPDGLFVLGRRGFSGHGTVHG